ncbi:cytochrome c [soil metagenome]
MTESLPMTSILRRRPALPIHLLALTAALVVGCRSEMYDQPRYEPLEPSAFFTDGKSARNLIAGTIPQGWSRTDEHFYEGRVDGKLVEEFPFPIDEDIVHRGRERYQIFCSPCHGDLGDGDGMIVRRGFPAPPTLHSDRLREIPVGHFYDVITRGFGAMYSYEHRVKPRDRWAIAAYIRALQLSQHAVVSEFEGLETDIERGLSNQRQEQEQARRQLESETAE